MAAITAAAEASETSCSLLRPPISTATRRFTPCPSSCPAPCRCPARGRRGHHVARRARGPVADRDRDGRAARHHQPRRRVLVDDDADGLVGLGGLARHGEARLLELEPGVGGEVADHVRHLDGRGGLRRRPGSPGCRGRPRRSRRGPARSRCPGRPTCSAAVLTEPTSRPASRILCSASDCCRPRRLGTLTCSGPLDTTIVTVLPRGACWPPAGVWRMTTPSSTSSLASVWAIHGEVLGAQGRRRGVLLLVGHVGHGRVARAPR